MLAKLFFLFTLLSAAELYVLIKMGEVIGAWETVLFLFVMGLSGALLARSQGLAAIGRFQSAVSRGEAPTAEILDGLLILLGGALLAAPGALTDIMGAILLIPFTRRLFREYLLSKILLEVKRGRQGRGFYHSSNPRQDGGVIDV